MIINILGTVIYPAFVIYPMFVTTVNLIYYMYTKSQIVILYQKNSFKCGFKASRYKKSNKNQIYFGEITQYAFESLKFTHKQHKF